MKLKYRGIEYDYTPEPVRYGPSYGVGTYRGVPVNLRSVEGIHVDEHPVYNLKYRGISYTTGSDIVEKSRSILAGERQEERLRKRLVLARM